MSIVMTALAVAGAQVAPAPVPAAQPANHAQHQQSAPKHGGEGCCCCKDKAEKMACCDKQEKAGGQGGHAGHSNQ